MPDAVKPEADAGKAPWQINGFAVQTRRLAVGCAKRAGLTIGEWMDLAVHSQHRLDDGQHVFPPASGIKPASHPTKPSSLGTEQLADLMHGMAALAAATGTSPAKTDVRRAYHLVDAHIRDASGLPPRPRRARIGRAFGQAALENGQAEHLNGIGGRVQ